MNIQSVVENGSCTGCSSCRQSCPVGAIRMVYNETGFLEPQIEATACTDCGICVQKCPIEAGEAPYPVLNKCIAAVAADEWRYRASSGGIFPAIADMFIQAGGYVAGAAFDESFHLEHRIVHTREELGALYESKYVQSDMGDVFAEIRQLLETGNAVLFCGCPCQAGGGETVSGKGLRESFYAGFHLSRGTVSRRIWEVCSGAVRTGGSRENQFP